jgi:hypothetical protein
LDFGNRQVALLHYLAIGQSIGITNGRSTSGRGIRSIIIIIRSSGPYSNLPNDIIWRLLVTVGVFASQSLSPSTGSQRRSRQIPILVYPDFNDNERLETYGCVKDLGCCFSCARGICCAINQHNNLK